MYPLLNVTFLVKLTLGNCGNEITMVELGGGGLYIIYITS